MSEHPTSSTHAEPMQIWRDGMQAGLKTACAAIEAIRAECVDRSTQTEDETTLLILRTQTDVLQGVADGLQDLLQLSQETRTRSENGRI